MPRTFDKTSDAREPLSINSTAQIYPVLLATTSSALFSRPMLVNLLGYKIRKFPKIASKTVIRSPALLPFMAPAVGTRIDGPDFVGDRLEVLTVVFVPGNWIFPLVAAAPWTVILDTAELPGTLTGGPGMM